VDEAECMERVSKSRGEKEGVGGERTRDNEKVDHASRFKPGSNHDPLLSPLQSQKWTR